MRIGFTGLLAALSLPTILTATAAGAASIDSAPLKVLAALECPANEGALMRVAQAPDGRSCEYRGASGETVRLKLVSLEGRSAAEALAPTKAELHALVPLYDRPTAGGDSDLSGDRADVDLPFLHVHATDDHAEVKLFGLRLRGDGGGRRPDPERGRTRTRVRAGAKGAVVTAEEVGRANASMVYVLAAKKPAASGYRTAGYVAKGPAQGPLVVGEFLSTEKRDRVRARARDHVRNDDIGSLIDRNVEG